MTQATNNSGPTIPFAQAIAMPPGIKMELERRVGRSLSDEEARSLILLHGGLSSPAGSSNIAPNMDPASDINPGFATSGSDAEFLQGEIPAGWGPGGTRGLSDGESDYDEEWRKLIGAPLSDRAKQFFSTDPPAGWGPGGTRGLSTGESDYAKEWQARADLQATPPGVPSQGVGPASSAAAVTAQEKSDGGLKGLFTRGDGMGFRILQLLGQLGGGIANRRAIKEANRQNRESQARANLINALSRRRVAEGTNVQPSLGLLGTLSDVVSGAGKAGLDIQQFGRSEEDRKLRNELDKRKVASGEKTADAYALNARANLLQRLAGTPTKKIEWSDSQVKSFARSIANLEPIEDETWEEMLERAGISIENVSQKSQDFLRSLVGAPEPTDPENLDQGKIEIFAKAIREVRSKNPKLSFDDAMEELGYDDMNWSETSRGAIEAWRSDDEGGAGDGGDISATGQRFITEAQIFRANVAGIRQLWDSSDIKGFWSRTLRKVGIPLSQQFNEEEGGLPEDGMFDAWFQGWFPEDTELRERLQAFSIGYAAAMNQGRPTEPDRKFAAMDLPNPDQDPEIGESKLNRLEDIAIADEIFKRWNFGGYAEGATDDDVFKLQDFIIYGPATGGENKGLDATRMVSAAIARGLPEQAGEELWRQLQEEQEKRKQRGSDDGGQTAESQQVPDTHFGGLPNEVLDRIVGRITASSQDTTGSE